MSTPATRRSITAPTGFYAAGGTCGIKQSGLPDLAVIISNRPCIAAGVFSKSRTPGAPLIVSKRHLRGGRASAIIINSGNANASTGEQGIKDAEMMCQVVAEGLVRSHVAPLRELGLSTRDVLVGSTGIIGRPMPMDRVGPGIVALLDRLEQSPEADAAAAQAIMTTDLIAKTAHRQVKLKGKAVHLGGIAKGSGMIAPNMGTMLVYITTDAAITPPLLNKALKQAAIASFNRISVDQHTSPSDMVLLLANGAAEHEPITKQDTDYATFYEALLDLCRDLAYQIVRDGEGATKVFRVQVEQAKTEREADRIAKAIVDSPLVKTAVHGGDPNWGRIVTAAGYSGVPITPERMSLHIREGKRSVCVFAKGTPTMLSASEQRQLEAMMGKKEITFTLQIGRGDVQVEWMGCDLSRQYIAINADYTT